MGRRVPIVSIADGEWGEVWTSRQQLISRLAKRKWPCVYTEGTLSTWDRGGRAWRNAGWLSRVEHSDGVSICRAGRLLASHPRLPNHGRFTRRWHARRIRRELRVGPADPLILYLFHPRNLPWVEALEPCWVIYHAVDLYASLSGWTEADIRRERELTHRADLLIGVNQRILDALPSVDQTPRHVVENAADAALFASADEAPCPADLDAIPQPRIGYIGRLTLKIDFPMIAAVAQARPDWHWALVGPVVLPRSASGERNQETISAYEACQGLPNVHFLGRRPYHDLPPYLANTAVNVLCYRQDEGWWSFSSQPLKLYEYLSAARPVVSSPLLSGGNVEQVVDFATDADSWQSAIERALEGGVGTPASRRAAVAGNTWDDRVADLQNWLEELVSRPPGPDTNLADPAKK